MSKIFFHKFPVTSQVFYKSKFTFALVNLKPIVPGHVLVVPLRVVPRLKDLSPEESVDYIMTVQLIHSFIEKVYKADSLNLAMQDGVAAGQSVPHVHTHIIPRYLNDGYGDGIYELLESHEQDLHSFFQMAVKKMQVARDEDRKPRSMEVMEKEAEWLRAELGEFIKSREALQSAEAKDVGGLLQSRDQEA
ncbi:hypothetical protein KL932_002127 [Ogataea haglerorum]|uniref:Bis(5'-adenosyl)-triphosphatase n=1 Tax=Ogataea haglerorum TaxID=1937702 RepID=A0ABQ7REY4_9ASCO|nr:hypothetical protein KL915_003022 [Ogataea haglerorum]KAG7705615.1 hypothetical protein KL914_003453 [Ogataea haglerorum]KAG7743386.1 hypothetical protein KL932_002127 [Ogataea haglerorum]KAG7764423.1 hypothetical protein KL946_003103 [Ogataea haglerorum]KAG7808282.1 hypothetical protein KL924_003328 [Ogataea haglerorum]